MYGWGLFFLISGISIALAIFGAVIYQVTANKHWQWEGFFFGAITFSMVGVITAVFVGLITGEGHASGLYESRNEVVEVVTDLNGDGQQIGFINPKGQFCVATKIRDYKVTNVACQS